MTIGCNQSSGIRRRSKLLELRVLRMMTQHFGSSVWHWMPEALKGGGLCEFIDKVGPLWILSGTCWLAVVYLFLNIPAIWFYLQYFLKLLYPLSIFIFPLFCVVILYTDRSESERSVGGGNSGDAVICTGCLKNWTRCLNAPTILLLDYSKALKLER